MKLRLLALSALLLTLSYATPRVVAQAQSTAAPKDQSASDSADESSAPTTTPPATASTPAASTAPAPVTGADPDKVKHEGGKTDVDAVGNRNVGCKTGLGNWYGVEKQIAMGKSYAQQVESSVKLIQDPVVTEYVNRVGQNLVRNSDAQVPFTIKVIDSDDINAFALPGGFFYVNSGLILAADEEAELAGVMAHEIAHVAACHAARENTRGNLMQMASIPLIFVGGAVGYAGYQAMSLALPLTFLQFSRGFEADADYLGLRVHVQVRLRSASLLQLLRKGAGTGEEEAGDLVQGVLHPPPDAGPDRKVAAGDRNHPAGARPQYVVSTSEFDDVKVAAGGNRKPPQDEGQDRRQEQAEPAASLFH